MARIRTIKPEFWQDEKLALLSPITRLVFLGLVSQADDAGRLVDNLKLLDGMLFPYTDDSCADSLEELARLGRIVRYRSESGQQLIQVVNWTKHQNVQKPSRYTLPPPPEDALQALSGDSTETVERLPVSDLGPTTYTQRPPSARAEAPEPPPAPPAPGRTDGRVAWMEEMKSDVAAFEARTGRPASAKALMIVQGEDAAAWQTPTGERVPWEDRPRLLRLALARLEDGGSDTLRGALRYVIPQQLDPLSAPTAADLAARRVVVPAAAGITTSDTPAPPPGVSPLLRAEIEMAEREAEQAREARLRAEEDAALRRAVAAWEAANELLARRYREEARAEAEANDFKHLLGGAEKLAEMTYLARMKEILGGEARDHAAA